LKGVPDELKVHKSLCGRKDGRSSIARSDNILELMLKPILPEKHGMAT